jgi:hypothetical protein
LKPRLSRANLATVVHYLEILQTPECYRATECFCHALQRFANAYGCLAISQRQFRHGRHEVGESTLSRKSVGRRAWL